MHNEEATFNLAVIQVQITQGLDYLAVGGTKELTASLDADAEVREVSPGYPPGYVWDRTNNGKAYYVDGQTTSTSSVGQSATIKGFVASDHLDDTKAWGYYYFQKWPGGDNVYTAAYDPFTVVGITPQPDEVEAGDEYSFSVIPADLATTATFLWSQDEMKFFKPSPIKDRYTSSDLLSGSELTSRTVTGRFITGMKSSVGETGLGTRTLQCTVTGAGDSVTVKYSTMVSLASAKITFYYVPYEASPGFPDECGFAVSAMIGETLTTIYTSEPFYEAAKMNGTGVLHRVRTTVSTKSQGDLPPAKYFKWSGGNFVFTSSITGGYGVALGHQDGAHYYVDHGDTQHRSFTNAAQYGGTYRIEGLKAYMDNAITTMQLTGHLQYPGVIGGTESVPIKDTGPFDYKRDRDPPRNLNQATDEKHIDILVFPSDSGTTVGIHPYNMTILGTKKLRTVKP